MPGGTSGGSSSAKPGANTGVVAGGKTSAADSLAHTGIDMSLVTVLAMIRVGEKLLQRYGARLPMMAGPVLTAIAIALISCTFLEKALYIGVVFASNVLFGLGLGCYATPSTDTAVAKDRKSVV